MSAREMLTGKLPKRNARLIRRERRARHRTITPGAWVAVGHGKGLRVGRVAAHYRHGFGAFEVGIEWADGLYTIIRADALRIASGKERKADRRRRGGRS